ncbi:hypothetical protein PPYR_06148 [Photinus pyralis]|uniref:DNA-directed DNA polymerase n=2 Tax=Photinus pyralis TaxID=7054 RepID=A0A5N4AT56_PHOPY|nr:hypothetical protein PPYR_06148 [Photinus pyralis]
MSKNSPNNKKLQKDFVFAFYDFECRQDDAYENRPATFLHVPNLCEVQHMCRQCINNDTSINTPCVNWGPRQHIFQTSPVTELLNYIANMARKNREVVAIAHNSKGYDSIFILREIMKNPSAWNPQIIATGTKITSLARIINAEVKRETLPLVLANRIRSLQEEQVMFGNDARDLRLTVAYLNADRIVLYNSIITRIEAIQILIEWFTDSPLDPDNDFPRVTVEEREIGSGRRQVGELLYHRAI